MTEDPSLAARMRDVLSPQVFQDAGRRAAEAYSFHKRRSATADVAEQAHKDAYRESLVEALLPLFLALQEEQRREIRSTFERWLTQGYTDAGETPLDDYGQEVVREVLVTLAASSSSPARTET